MKQIIKNLKAKDVLLMFVCVGLIALQVFLELKLPNYMIEITALLKTPGTKVSIIWEKGGLMLLCALGNMFSAIIVSLFVARIAAGFSMRLRANVFSKIESFSFEQIKKFSTASLITRTTNDVSQMQMVIAMGMQAIIKAPILAVWAIIDMSSTNWQCSIATAVAVSILLIVISIIITLALPRFKKMQTLTDNINRVTRENLEGVRVVRAYNAENFEKAKFEKANEELTQNSLFASRVMNILSPTMSFVMQGLTLSIYLIGAIILSKTAGMNKLTVFSEIMGFTQFAMYVISAFMMLSMIFMMLTISRASAERVAELLQEEPELSSRPGAEKEIPDGSVCFRNVSFSYSKEQERPCLQDIKLEIPSGATVGILGGTGSGKSTLVQLIPRLYDASRGQVLVGGKDVRDYDLESLRDAVAMVLQKNTLFSGSIRENLRWGDPEATEEEMIHACRLAQADAFIRQFPDGYDTHIEQGGVNVSGGQRQRLCIARALLKKPKILILDDSTSAVDTATDAQIRRAFREEIPHTTKFIIAQRISSVQDADIILVMDGGRLIARGSHSQLLESCPIYREVYESQQKGDGDHAA